jgi:hypothetical protein
MSLYAEGIPAAKVVFNGSPRTHMSLAFFSKLGRSDLGKILITTAVSPRAPFSFTLSCLLSPSTEYDVSLGSDWASLSREALLASGLRLDSTFDAWDFFSNPLHPISSELPLYA